MEQLIKQLEQWYASRPQIVLQPGSDNYLQVGMGTVTPSSHYYWDGLKRGGDPNHPLFLFQYTLDGWGCYAEGNNVQKLYPKMAFTAIIPSEHVYYLPPESSNWSYFWIIMSHPYIVSRITQRKKAVGAVLTIEPTQLLLTQALKLIESACYRTFRDMFAQEQALFNFLIEYERFAQRLNCEDDQRERVLEEVRNYICGNLDKPVGVTELAGLKGMSRSHFSHYFKTATGLSPAQFMLDIRLEEAARLLLESQQKVEVIGTLTGFVNPNHFCRVFRQHFHLSPGEFRRQLR